MSDAGTMLPRTSNERQVQGWIAWLPGEAVPGSRAAACVSLLPVSARRCARRGAVLLCRER